MMILRRIRAARSSRMLIAFILLALAIPGMSQPAPVTQAAQPTQQVVPAPCDQIVAVPPQECTALVNLYQATSSTGWLHAEGWLALQSPASPCDWYGVICAGGHVVELALAANRLTGALPAIAAGLPYLERLSLAGNHLRGTVPSDICLLTDTVSAADLAYNALDTRRADTRACLDQLDPGWRTTQTIVPRNIQITTIETDSIQLTWNPIPYTAGAGFYEVSYATTADGPYIIHGQTADKQAGGYLLDGLASGVTYFVRVQSVTAPHAGNANEVRSESAISPVVTRAAERIRLMVYFPADNDLAPYVGNVITRLQIGSRRNPNVQVVMLADGRGTQDTALLTIADGEVQPTDLIFTEWGTRELDTADPETLAWFLRYARTHYPADREIVALMGHGVALAPELAWPESLPETAAAPEEYTPQTRIPALPKGLEATPGDVTDRGYMSTIGVGQALLAATDGGANPFDLVFFDQCFQGNLDTLYEVRATAEVFIASPNYAWLVAPYAQYLAMMAPAASTEDIAIAIINRYQGNLNNRHPNVIFGLTSADIAVIADKVSALGQALQRATRAGARNAISSAVRNSEYVDTTQCGQQNLTLGPPDELIGAGSFAQNLTRTFPTNDRHGVHTAADQLLTALTRVHKSVRSGQPYIAPGEFWGYDNSVTILAPLPPTTPASIAWRSSIYTETMPLQAAWTPVPTMTVTVTASFAFVRDGAWDEFLSTWYSTPLAPTVGEWCNYIPPALVTSDDESLTVTVAQGSSGPRLEWSPTTNEDAAAYVIYAKGPYDIGWVTHAVLPPDQTSVELASLLLGAEYELKIVAQDAAGLTLAQSNEVVWQIAGFVQRLYLPLV